MTEQIEAILEVMEEVYPQDLTVKEIADNIKILSEGHIISEGSPSSIVKDVSARKVYFGDTY